MPIDIQGKNETMRKANHVIRPLGEGNRESPEYEGS